MTKIKIKDIIPFKNHPFKIDEDDSLKELMESIDTTGLINPVIVRKKSDKYFDINKLFFPLYRS